ncbi:thiopurine S-methyltransferase [Pseudomonas huanghezhanensis]|uniref:thiopurine S-methyltransferase n=1 Tax=Pseudomonas huanghezhanensis TaxID=3002903 RepID=UPI0022855C93|nr:thiopurine S-methyltransferase [Pseudomonas sp. BSw22131]
MQPDFWQQRWASDQIGFNQPQVNPYLQRFWSQLSVKKAERVFVPLCGKSVDMIWLLQQGLSVVGVELAEKAVEDYFAEREVVPRKEQRGAFKVFSHEACQIWCGDFFQLKARDIGSCSVLYDRAALIALPPEMRLRYVEHLNKILPADCRGLLITLDYEQSQIAGPPFAVPEDEVVQLLSPEWRLKLIAEKNVLQDSRKFLQAGATRLSEQVYSLFRR